MRAWLPLAALAASCGGPAPIAPRPPPPTTTPAPAPIAPTPAPAPPGGEVTFAPPGPPAITGLSFTDGGARLLATGGPTLVEIDPVTRRELGRIRLDSARVPNPNGRLGSGESLQATIEMATVWAWDAPAAELVGVATVGSWGVGPRGPNVVRPASGAAPAPFHAKLGAVCVPLALSPDRTRVALTVNARKDGWCDGANSVQVFDLATQRPVTPPVEIGFIGAAAFSADGRRLAIGGARAHIYDLDTHALVTAPTSSVIRAIAFDPTSPRIAWQTDDREIESWRPGDAANADLGEGTAIAFAPDGHLAVARRDAIELLAPDGARARWIALPDRGAIDTLAFADDGRQLAAAGWSRVDVWQLEPLAPPALSGWFARARPLPVPAPPPLPPFTPTGTYEGRVLLGGAPVVGAEIVLRPIGQEYPDAAALPPIKARSGAGGRVRLTGLPTINWQLWVTRRGALREGRQLLLRTQPSMRFDIEMSPAATVVGRVLGPDRRPARGVRLYRPDDHRGAALDLAAGADGTFTIDHLRPASTLHVTATRRDGAVRHTAIELPRAGVTRVTIVLAAADDPQVVRGTVVDAAGAPLADVLVVINETYTVKTDARGRFAGDVPGSRGAVRVFGPHLRSDPQRVTLPLTAPLTLVATPH